VDNSFWEGLQVLLKGDVTPSADRRSFAADDIFGLNAWWML